MSKLAKLFKKKPGGTLFGNVLRGVTKLASATGLVPGAGLVSSLLPDAPPLVRETALQFVAEAASTPALSSAESRVIASEAKQAVLDAGGSVLEARNVGAAAFAASSVPPAQAEQVLQSAAVQVNSFGAKDLKTILNGAVSGAQDGATDAYLNKTDVGKAQKKGAINAEGAKVMPWILGTCIGIIGFLLIKKD